MSGPNFFIYFYCKNKGYMVNITQNPALDYSYLKGQGIKFYFLDPPLPIGVAYWLLQKMRKKLNSGYSLIGMKHGTLANPEKLLKMAGKYLNRLDYKVNFRMGEITENFGYLVPSHEDLVAVEKVLRGRILKPGEVKRALDEHNGQVKFALDEIIQALYLEKKLEIIPSLGIDEKGQLKCFRCGEKKMIFPAECIDCRPLSCFYCENCLAMGEARLCEPLYAMESNTDVKTEVKLQLDFELTGAQKDASKALGEFILKREQREFLVYAATGAGKTEISFKAIETTLNKGGRVLFAIPRRDVVIELLPRLQKAFPCVPVKALYGGSTEKFNDSPLVAATTHQAIRFYKSFDLVVLDEVDAYPYKGSKMLRMAVRRACKPGGKLIFMTATPDRAMVSFWGKKLPMAILPVRYHGYPLPEPQIIKINLDDFLRGSLKGVPDILTSFIEKCKKNKTPLIIFVPTVEIARLTGKKLKLEYCHSKDPERDLKRENFCKGENPIIVSTTILERGITVPGVKVIVLFADKENIFDEGSLIQMAGRSGRTMKDPFGEVLFIASTITPAMKGAVKKIRFLNREARKSGYLKE